MYGGTAVPLSMIANFPKVRELCQGHTDLQFLMRAVEGSTVVSVTSDAMWISPLLPIPPLEPNTTQRPNPAALVSVGVGGGVHLSQTQVQVQTQVMPVATYVEVKSPSAASSQNSQGSSGGIDNDGASSINTNTTANKAKSAARSTIILRDIPSDWHPSKIMEAFTVDNVVPKSARADVGNTWYITFHSESDALAAVLNTKDDEIDGCPIRARIKSETVPPTVGESARQLADPPKHSLPSGGQIQTPLVSDISQQPQQTPATVTQPGPQHQTSHSTVAAAGGGAAATTTLPQTTTISAAPPNMQTPLQHTAPQIAMPPGPTPTAYTYHHLPYSYTTPGGSAAGGGAYHHPGGYPAAYPQQVPMPYVYGYPYVQQPHGGQAAGVNNRYYSGVGRSGSIGGGVGGTHVNRNDGVEVENGISRRNSAGKVGDVASGGGTGGGGKRKTKVKKGGGMQNYPHHDQAVTANSAQYGQHHRWKNSGSGSVDGGMGNINDVGDAYGKRMDGNRNHHNRRNYDHNNNSNNWSNTARNNNRSQNDNISTSSDTRISSGGGDYYNNNESTNPPLLMRGSSAPINTKGGGGGTRKKKNKRRDGEKDFSSTNTADDRKREIFDSNSFPALSPSKNGSNTTTTISRGGTGGEPLKPQSALDEARRQMSGYADALKQTNRSGRSGSITSSVVDHRPMSAPLIQSTEKVTQANVSNPANTSSSSSKNKASEKSNTPTVTKAAEAMSALKVTSSSTNPQQQQRDVEQQTTATTTTTTVAVGAVTGTQTTSTVIGIGRLESGTTRLENNIPTPNSATATSATKEVEVVEHNKSNAITKIRQPISEPTPREASHIVNHHQNKQQPSSSEVIATVVEGVDTRAASTKSGTVDKKQVKVIESSPSPPSAWGSKRSYIDVARKQS